MAATVYFWPETVYYSVSDFSELWQALFIGDNGATEGVLRHPVSGPGGLFAAAGATTPVVVQDGWGVTPKGPVHIDASTNVAVPTPSADTRKDRIVLRIVWATKTASIERVAGVEGGDYPALTQTDGVTWELPLWKADITTGGAITLTDDRTYCAFSTKVTEDMIDDGSITTDKVADEAITAAKIDDRTRYIWSPAGSWAISEDAEFIVNGAYSLCPVASLPDLLLNTIAGSIAIPADYGSGTLTADLWWISQAGNAYLYFATTARAAGEAADLYPPEAILNWAAKASAGAGLVTVTELLSGIPVTAGDVLYFNLQRDASSPSDTIAEGGAMDLIGIRFDYTADS